MLSFELDRLLYQFLKPFTPIILAIYGLLISMLEKISFSIPIGQSKLQKFAWIRNRSLHEDIFQKLQHHQNAFWIHCASGEFEYAKPVIAELKARGHSVVVSYFSPTYRSAIENTAGVDFSFPIPWDKAEHCQRLLLTLKPRALLMARTDVWLNLLIACGRSHVPRILFASPLNQLRFESQSLLKRIWLRFILPHLDLISLVSKEEIKFLRTLVTERTHVRADGDTRYDQVFRRLAHPQILREEARPLEQRRFPVIVCGSTWPEDEKVLLDAIKQTPEWRWIIAPHEPTESHVQSLEAELSALKVPCTLYSTPTLSADWKVLIVDRVGILAELYQWGTAAFVGGSFKGSVHSVMEPLAAGLMTFVGPYFQNNTEAVRFLSAELREFQRLNVVNSIQDGDQLSILLDLIHGSQGNAGSEIKAMISENQGASALLVDALEIQVSGLAAIRLSEYDSPGPS